MALSPATLSILLEFNKNVHLCGKKKCNVPAVIISMFLCHRSVTVVLGVLFASVQCPFQVKDVTEHLDLKVMLSVTHRQWKTIWVGS